MTRIDFYILEDVATSAMQRFACRLAMKAMANGQPVLIQTPDEATTTEVDELLWHYPDRRFLPHAIQHTEGAERSPVLLGWRDPERYDGLLINLSAGIPSYFNRFHRVAEIVVQENRTSGRERFRYYKHRGYPLYDHPIDEWETEAGPA